MTFDLGNLYAYNPSPLNFDELFQYDSNINVNNNDNSNVNINTNEKYLQQISRNNVQALMNELCKLPAVITQDHSSVLARLPPTKIKFPRSKPLPTDKPLTRWEKYAAQQGIRKKKEINHCWHGMKVHKNGRKDLDLIEPIIHWLILFMNIKKMMI